MKEIQPIKFIHGTFSPEEAKEVLIGLINHKIHFHSLKNFSSEERFGKPIAGSEKRIKQLKASREKINKLIDKAAKQNCKLKLESSINIIFEQ